MDHPKFLIYGLVDPRTQELRYVGKSCSGLRRPRVHGCPSTAATYGHLPVVRWAKKLGAMGLRYDIEVLEVHERAEDLVDAERFFIAYFRSLGCDLLNLTEGGDGLVAPSSVVRERMAAAQRRRFERPEERAKIGEFWRGKKQSAETKAKRSRSVAGVWASPGYVEKLVAAHGGRPVVDDAGVVYVSAREAARRLDTDSGSIGRAIRTGGRAGGHTFRYVE